MNIAIFLYDDAEVLDFAGPFEVFNTAKRLARPDWNVFLIAENSELITARGGMLVQPHYSINSHPPIDVLLVAGGVHQPQMGNQSVLDWISQVAESAHKVASVCTGAFLLAQAGLLDGLNVTTHWEDIAELQGTFPSLKVISQRKWVDQGKFITSGGISAGMDMSLHLVSQLASLELASLTATQMEYRWSNILP
ncbi:DJ-1/PfpI family protein [Vibrio sp.]|uniref:DJ-1/PfpI family protein n=1 Tax=Vibrio sp. TaxID=678 RepID=UPI003D0FF199